MDFLDRLRETEEKTSQMRRDKEDILAEYTKIRSQFDMLVKEYRTVLRELTRTQTEIKRLNEENYDMKHRIRVVETVLEHPRLRSKRGLPSQEKAKALGTASVVFYAETARLVRNTIRALYIRSPNTLGVWRYDNLFVVDLDEISSFLPPGITAKIAKDVLQKANLTVRKTKNLKSVPGWVTFPPNAVVFQDVD